MPEYRGQNFADGIGRLAGLQPEDRDVVAYGLEYLLSALFVLALMLGAGLALGLFWETVAVLCCWGLLRQFAGGAHCTALWRCAVANITGLVTAVLIARASLLLFEPAAWIAICTTWAFIAVWLWAPNNSERPVENPDHRRRLRRWSLALLLLIGAVLFYPTYSGNEEFQLLAAAGATGLAAGALMLSPFGFQLINRLDQVMQNLYQTYSSTKKGGEAK